MVQTTWFLLVFVLASAFVSDIASRHRRTQVERREAQSLEVAMENWFEGERNASICESPEPSWDAECQSVAEPPSGRLRPILIVKGTLKSTLGVRETRGDLK